MDHTQILLRPVVTEKATRLRESKDHQVVSFFVHADANKIEIKRAVEKAFHVKVTDVNVMSKKPSIKLKNRRAIHIAGWRKAYVTLESGAKIDFFEGA